MKVYLKTFLRTNSFDDCEDIIMGILDEKTYKKDRLLYLNQVLEEKAKELLL